MKIAIFADPHMGYRRFEEDSYTNAEKAMASASEQADLILCAGDIFDTKIPKLETLKRAIDIFKNARKPVVAIHGNHERRTKDLVNPVQLLAASTSIRLLHGKAYTFEKDGEKVQIFGLGSVPEEYAEAALKKSLEGFRPEEGALKVLMIHQTIKELVPASEDELSLEYLESLPFDLIINGHIHEKMAKLSGRFLIPGSTVITQLKKEQMEDRGYYLYDTRTRKTEFIPIGSRKFFYEELRFDRAEEARIRDEIHKRISGIRKDHPDAIIAIKIEGSTRSGLSLSAIKSEYQDVFIENRMDSESLATKLEKIRDLRQDKLPARDLAVRELSKKTEGKITRFDPAELFEKLTEGVDEALDYLESSNKKEKQEKE